MFVNRQTDIAVQIKGRTNSIKVIKWLGTGRYNVLVFIFSEVNEKRCLCILSTRYVKCDINALNLVRFCMLQLIGRIQIIETVLWDSPLLVHYATAYTRIGWKTGRVGGGVVLPINRLGCQTKRKIDTLWFSWNHGLWTIQRNFKWVWVHANNHQDSKRIQIFLSLPLSRTMKKEIMYL